MALYGRRNKLAYSAIEPNRLIVARVESPESMAH